MLKKILKYLLLLFLVLIIIIISINLLMILNTNSRIITINSSKIRKNIDCILILGAGIYGNYPTPMLEDRLQTGLSLYKENPSTKILVSGDHINESHDEVNVMKDYLVGRLVPSQDIFMDHAGISTYDSIYRAKEIFNAKKIIIVTQKYHLYRALYIAKQLNLDAYGIATTKKTYSGQNLREIREILAITKDFFKSHRKPQSTYLGKKIPITSNGDLTNDYN